MCHPRRPRWPPYKHRANGHRQGHIRQAQCRRVCHPRRPGWPPYKHQANGHRQPPAAARMAALQAPSQRPQAATRGGQDGRPTNTRPTATGAVRPEPRKGFRVNLALHIAKQRRGPTLLCAGLGDLPDWRVLCRRGRDHRLPRGICHWPIEVFRGAVPESRSRLPFWLARWK